ncbi:hypothetical protein BDV25DRAFT_161954 [Aspergillus avenaceus]|uniref:LYR motif-containing protein Cup1-like N-terminal domain-containing protein n=1 Tax=Aspergillus avenaceus TaxID=36643 RepID=A0A5N6TK26_ASPAV|nr:hypothetical protein BDV25DRAFT_161954 [Aspergillus avenaceus]
MKGPLKRLVPPVITPPKPSQLEPFPPKPPPRRPLPRNPHQRGPPLPNPAPAPIKSDILLSTPGLDDNEGGPRLLVDPAEKDRLKEKIKAEMKATLYANNRESPSTLSRPDVNPWKIYKWRSVCRSLLRQCTYLPDPCARSYMHDYIVSRFRRYVYQKRELWDEVVAERRKSLFKEATKTTILLFKASLGFTKPLEKILRLTYARKGRRKRELLDALVAPEVPADKAAVEKVIQQPERYGDDWQPPVIVMDLLKSQTSNPLLPLLGFRQLKHLEPVIPKACSWGGGIAESRRKRIRHQWYQDVLDHLLPPLPQEDMKILEGLMSGAMPWRPPKRRKMKPVPKKVYLDSDDALLLELEEMESLLRDGEPELPDPYEQLLIEWGFSPGDGIFPEMTDKTNTSGIKQNKKQKFVPSYDNAWIFDEVMNGADPREIKQDEKRKSVPDNDNAWVFDEAMDEVDTREIGKDEEQSSDPDNDDAWLSDEGTDKEIPVFKRRLDPQKLKNSRTFLHHILTKGPAKTRTFRLFVTGRPHAITRRFMQRLWKRTYCLTPKMTYDEKTQKHYFQWDSGRAVPRLGIPGSPEIFENVNDEGKALAEAFDKSLHYKLRKQIGKDYRDRVKQDRRDRLSPEQKEKIRQKNVAKRQNPHKLENKALTKLSKIEGYFARAKVKAAQRTQREFDRNPFGF